MFAVWAVMGVAALWWLGLGTEVDADGTLVAPPTGGRYGLTLLGVAALQGVYACGELLPRALRRGVDVNLGISLYLAVVAGDLVVISGYFMFLDVAVSLSGTGVGVD